MNLAEFSLVSTESIINIFASEKKEELTFLINWNYRIYLILAIFYIF